MSFFIRSKQEQKIAPSKDHISGLDSVRALAALSVMLAHILAPSLEVLLNFTPLSGTIFPAFGKYAFTGLPAVITFFVISGFCIHYPYVHMSLAVLPFLAARWVRIMLPVLAAFVFLPLSKIKGFNFWDGYILWSIVCEVFYYTIYPLLFFASRWIPFVVQWLISMIISYILVILLGSDEFGNIHIYGPFLNWLVMLPSWLIGCVLAETIAKSCRQNKSFKNINMLPIRGGIIFLWRFAIASTASTLIYLTLNTTIGVYLTANCFAALVYFWLKAEINHVPPANSWLEKIGKWSYSIYLMHMLFYVALYRLIGLFIGKSALVSNSNQILPFSIIITLFLCYLFYRKIEYTSHNYARRIFKTMPVFGFIINRKNTP